jgi:hypothetical protein
MVLAPVTTERVPVELVVEQLLPASTLPPLDDDEPELEPEPDPELEVEPELEPEPEAEPELEPELELEPDAEPELDPAPELDAEDPEPDPELEPLDPDAPAPELDEELAEEDPPSWPPELPEDEPLVDAAPSGWSTPVDDASPLDPHPAATARLATRIHTATKGILPLAIGAPRRQGLELGVLGGELTVHQTSAFLGKVNGVPDLGLKIESALPSTTNLYGLGARRGYYGHTSPRSRLGSPAVNRPAPARRPRRSRCECGCPRP